MQGRRTDARWCDDCQVAVPPSRGLCPRCSRVVGVPEPVGRTDTSRSAAPAANTESTTSRMRSHLETCLEAVEPVDLVAGLAVVLVSVAAVAVTVA